MKKLLLLVIAFVAVAFFGCDRHHAPFSGASSPAAAANDSVFGNAFEKHTSNVRVEGQGTVAKVLPDDAAAANDAVFANAFEKHTSNVRVEGQGTVAKLLPDDNDGSRHQRFIVRLSSGQTLLIAHNIDLAPRVPSLNEGDVVSFGGEYEWNSKGGVVHWTHHDPNGRHLAGWIKHAGQAFQ